MYVSYLQTLLATEGQKQVCHLGIDNGLAGDRMLFNINIYDQ